MPLSYFIYYRVSRPELAAQSVLRILESIRRKTGITGRVLRSRDDAATWMEIYERVEDVAAFESCLDASVAAAEFASVLDPGSRRHMERFEEPCA